MFVIQCIPCLVLPFFQPVSPHLAVLVSEKVVCACVCGVAFGFSVVHFSHPPDKLGTPLIPPVEAPPGSGLLACWS